MPDFVRCRRCETLPSRSEGPGWLHLHLPTQHSLSKALHHLHQIQRPVHHKGRMISVSVASEDLVTCLSALVAELSLAEREDTKVLFQPRDKVMELEDYFEMDSLQRFFAKCQSGWLISLLENKQLYSVFQPIICAQQGQIFAYECLIRATQDGEVVAPYRMFEVARHAGLIAQLDLAARFAAIQGAAQYQIKEHIFVNFTPSAIYDPKHCLRNTVRALDASDLQRSQVVFEVIESDEIKDVNHLRSILDFYREEGFCVALDDLGAGYSSLNLLHELRPDYVKLDVGLIRNVDQDDYKGLIAQKLLETARLLEVKTIAEGVETEPEYQWLKARGADYVQGYYFARPAVPPPRVHLSTLQQSLELT